MARNSSLQYIRQAVDVRTEGVGRPLPDRGYSATRVESDSPAAVFEIQDDLAARVDSTVAYQDGVLPQCMAEVLRGKREDVLTPHEVMLRSDADEGIDAFKGAVL